jgi:predicted thioesterase
METQKSLVTSALTPGLEGHAVATVGPALMAPAMGSGTVEVYATPAMVALMEAAAVDCVERLLPPGHVTLGVHLDVSHRAATPAGDAVSAHATLVAIDGRKLTFQIQARDSVEQIGEATHARVIVDRERFMARTTAKIARG